MDFTDERLIQRYNSELANGLGNLVNRTLTMAHKYRGGRLARSSGNGLREQAERCAGAFAAAMDAYSVSSALEKLAELVTEANQFVERNAPWKLAKQPGSEARLDAIFYHLAEVIRLIAIMISPVMPKAAGVILEQLNWPGACALSEAVWGKLPGGHQLGNPTPVFPRIEASGEAG